MMPSIASSTTTTTTTTTTMAAAAAVVLLLLCPSVFVMGFSVPTRSFIVSHQQAQQTRRLRTTIKPSPSPLSHLAASSMLYLQQSKNEGEDEELIVSSLYGSSSSSTHSRSNNNDVIIDVGNIDGTTITVEDKQENGELYYTPSSSSLTSFSSMNILMYEENRNPDDESIMEDLKVLENKILKSRNPVDEAFMEDIKLLQDKILTMKETNTAFAEDIKLKMKSSQSTIDEMKTEAYALAVQKNLPKKKPISLHSFISSMSVMSAFVLLLPTFHPGIDEYGLPQIFNYEYASVDLLWQSQLCAMLQMISSIMGIFRLPKRSPNVRTAGFLISALIISQLSLIVCSSLNGTSVYLFDAFSIQGRILISVVNTALLIGSFNSLTLIVGDKEQKGWGRLQYSDTV